MSISAKFCIKKHHHDIKWTKCPPTYPKKQYLCTEFKTKTTMNKKKLIKIIVSVLIAALTALGAALGLNSCNVVRTITNKSEFYQRGDTSVMIQTKTTESYDATKKL